MEELSGTVNSNADIARVANQLASQAAEIAWIGGQKVNDVVQTMHDITDSSNRIVEADFLKITLHAAYVVIQTSVEVELALQLRRAAVEASEMVHLVQQVKRDDALYLNLGDVPTTSPVASALKGVVESMAQSVARVTEVTHSIEVAAREMRWATLI